MANHGSTFSSTEATYRDSDETLLPTQRSTPVDTILSVTESLDPFEILGLTSDASKEEIRDAFLRLSRKVHSDQGGTDALFRQVKWAYDELKDRPETVPGANGTPNHGSDESSSTDETAYTSADEHVGTNGLAQWVKGNPAWFLFIVGIALLFVAGATHTSAVFGLLVSIVGFAGVTGIKPAAMVERFRNSNIRMVDTMNGKTFEIFLVSVFTREGYIVKLVGGTGDFGADLILRRGDHKSVVQAKRYAGNVGVDAVQEVAAARAHYKANRAIVVTNSHYTSAARALAKSNSVDLWERTDLVAVMARQSGIESIRGWTLLRTQLRYGIPQLIRRVLLIVFGLLGAVAAVSGSGSQSRRRRRRRRRHW